MRTEMHPVTLHQLRIEDPDKENFSDLLAGAAEYIEVEVEGAVAAISHSTDAAGQPMVLIFELIDTRSGEDDDSEILATIESGEAALFDENW